MQATQNMKDSGIEWIGKIPEHWEINKIKYCSYVKGRVGWHGLKADEFIDEGPFLITGTDFKDGGVNWAKCYHVSEQRYSQDPYIQICVEDVLITKDGTIGKVAYVDHLPGPATLNSHLLVIRPLDNKYRPRFLYWVLNADCFEAYVNLAQTGTTFFGITQEKIENFAFAVPPISDQDIIVRFLDKRVAIVEKLIFKNQKLIKALQEKRRGIINHTLTKGLDPNVSMKDSGIEWIGKIPEHWQLVRLKRIIKSGTMITYGIVQAGPHSEDGIPYIRTSDMAGNTLPPEGYLKTSPEIDRAYTRSKVSHGDIIVAIRATVGKALIVPDYLDGANLTQGTAKVSPGNKTSNKYLLYAINSHSSQQRFEALSKGATFKEITLEMLRNFIITFPPLQEQQLIGKYLDNISTNIDLLLHKVELQIEKLREYRQSLIFATVTGKIDARQQQSEAAISE